MIFSAKNEDGVPLWTLVLSGEKTVTRRTKPLPVGKTFAIQPGRGKKTIARARVISCHNDRAWCDETIYGLDDAPQDTIALNYFLDKEAQLEGFKTWEGLWTWIKGHYGDKLPTLYRIEFEVINDEGSL